MYCEDLFCQEITFRSTLEQIDFLLFDANKIHVYNKISCPQMDLFITSIRDFLQHFQHYSPQVTHEQELLFTVCCHRFTDLAIRSSYVQLAVTDSQI